MDIKVQSETNNNIIYYVNVTRCDCTCPDYIRNTENIFSYSYNPNYLCKHIKKLLTIPINLIEMIAVIKAVDGDVEVFINNYGELKLKLLLLWKIILIEDNKILVIE
jgi:hypothetical protein